MSMLPQTQTQALVTVTPDEQHTTCIEPFSERELSALDTVMGIETTEHHNLILQHASPGMASLPRDDHELHEAMYLAHHGIIHEVAPHWYGFTTLGIARAQATAQHAS